MKIVLAALLVFMPVAAQARDYILTPSGQRLGYTELRGDRLTAYTPGGRMLGYYDRRSDATYTPGGQMVARGNAVVAFITHL